MLKKQNKNIVQISKEDKRYFILESNICDHSLRTQAEVIPTNLFQHGSSFMKAYSNKQKYKQRHFVNIGRKVRKAGHRNLKEDFLTGPRHCPMTFSAFASIEGGTLFMNFNMICLILTRMLSHIFLRGINLSMTTYLFATCKSSVTVTYFISPYCTFPFPY